MSAHSIARRYAKSLIDLAIEEKKLDRIVEDSRMFLTALESRDLVLLLKSPIIKSDKKINIFSAIFKGKVDDLTLKFINIITRKGREAILSEIVKEVISQFNTLNNISTARLTTANKVDVAIVDGIKNKLGDGSGKMEIETQTDPAILGGYVLEMGDKLYDASIRRQINQLRKELANS
jgi:F-type H+-transporting ATPase subunit delta